jgi:predicted dehydrogenase
VAGRRGAIVIGTGFGVLTHLRALRAAGFEVLALVGRDPAKTQDRAKRSGVPHGLTDLARSLALPGVEVVSIATPPHTHCELALAAIAAGKHVVCEKPFARDAAEGERMLAAAEKAGVIHLIGTEFRFATAQALATRAVREGQIGEPRLATFVLQLPALADPRGEVPAWWSDASQGGGWLGAYASHVVDQMRHCMGEIEGVSASLQVLSDRAWTAEDTYSILFRTRAGATGVLQSSAGTWGAPLAVQRFVGTRGTLWTEGEDVWIGNASGARKLAVPDDLKHPAPVPPDPSLLVTAYDHLHSLGIDLGPFTKLFEGLRIRLEGGTPPADPIPATFADGLAVQRVLDAVRVAAREQRWVRPGSAGSR